MIATSTQRETACLHPERAGLSALFRDLKGGDQVATNKPAPDIYLRATIRLGHDPSNCFAFDDSPIGISAGHAAGLIAMKTPDIVAPEAELGALRHCIASNIIAGAQAVGLMVVPE
ncbi:HAD family hydrolase [Ruegeria spongiae]|uniref:HAD family hydrolase n=1 Tax=Ruegeria spongiae TaxID=2942209 RepID=UPI00357159C9